MSNSSARNTTWRAVVVPRAPARAGRAKLSKTTDAKISRNLGTLPPVGALKIASALRTNPSGALSRILFFRLKCSCFQLFSCSLQSSQAFVWEVQNPIWDSLARPSIRSSVSSTVKCMNSKPHAKGAWFRPRKYIGFKSLNFTDQNKGRPEKRTRIGSADGFHCRLQGFGLGGTALPLFVKLRHQHYG